MRRAQAAALDAVHPSVCAATLDRTARRVLAGFKLNKHFTHGLGHGVGLEVHEAPRVSSISKTRIRPGIVFTIEPGVYIDGLAGVRIEDTVALTTNGLKILTRSPKKLVIV